MVFPSQELRQTVGSKKILILVTLTILVLIPILLFAIDWKSYEDPSDLNNNNIADVIEIWIEKELPDDLSKKYAKKYVEKIYSFYESKDMFEADKRNIEIDNAKSCLLLTLSYYHFSNKNFPHYGIQLYDKVLKVQGNEVKFNYALRLLPNDKYYSTHLEAHSTLEHAKCEFTDEEKVSLVKKIYPFLNKSRQKKLVKYLTPNEGKK